MTVTEPAPRPRTAAELAAVGVVVAVVRDGLTAPRVDITAPLPLRAETRAAIAWRLEAMRRHLQRATPGIAVASQSVTIPMCPEVRARVRAQNPSGGTYWKDLHAQRAASGWCPSCGDPHAARGESGDCALCVAARIGALRAEGRLPAAAVAPPVPERPTYDAWRAELRALVAAHARPADPPAIVRWRCACGGEVESYGQPAEPRECGPCEVRRQSVTDMSRLGGRR